MQELEAWMSRTYRMEEGELRARDVRRPRSGWEQWNRKEEAHRERNRKEKQKSLGPRQDWLPRVKLENESGKPFQPLLG